jgi:hypothetical protein
VEEETERTKERKWEYIDNINLLAREGLRERKRERERQREREKRERELTNEAEISR